MAYGSLALQAFAFDGKFLELPEAVRSKFKRMDFDNAAIWRAFFENAPLTAGAREEYNSLLAELDVRGDDRDELIEQIATLHGLAHSLAHAASWWATAFRRLDLARAQPG